MKKIIKDEDFIYVAESNQMGGPIKEFSSYSAILNWMNRPESVGYAKYKVPKNEYLSFKKQYGVKTALNQILKQRKQTRLDSKPKDSMKTFRINKRFFVDAKNVKDAYRIYKKEIKARDDEDYYQNYKKRIVTENNYHKNDNSIEHTKKMILSDYKNGKLTKEEFDKLMRNIDKTDFSNWN